MKNNKFTKQLFNKYPELCEYGLLTKEKCQQLISWNGIECEYGWYDIINETLFEINKYCKQNKILNKVRVCQIKEKFGGLRIYIDYDKSIWNTRHSYIINEYIMKAEDKAIITCEFCGKPGKLNEKDYWITLCWKCKLGVWWNGIFNRKRY